jgi:acid phosphatase type 7
MSISTRLFFLGAAALAGLSPVALSLTASAVSTDDKPLGVLLLAGDIAGCTGEAMQSATATAAVLSGEFTNLKATHTPFRVLILGDLAYDDGTASEFGCFEESWGKALKSGIAEPDTAVMPVPGNHEYHTTGATAFFDTFKSNSWIGQSPEAYFQSVFPPATAGAWRLFGLNSEIANDPASPQYQWLSGQMADAVEGCILAFWHKPVFSSGEHGHTGSDTDQPVKQPDMADVESLLAQHGTSLIINGHDHNYEELSPHDESGQPDVQGVRSFIVGTGGRKLRHLKDARWKDISHVFDDKTHGILRLTLYPDRYSWTFLPSEGAIDAAYSGEVHCRTRAK